jgi:hypothetical protein
VTIVDLANISTAGTVGELHGEEDSALDHADVIGGDLKESKFGLDVKGSLLRNCED